MIRSDKRKEIIRRFIELSPENEKSKVLTKKLLKSLRRYSFSRLTELEKEFLEKYPDKIEYQSSVDLTGQGFCFTSKDKNLLTPENFWTFKCEVRSLAYSSIYYSLMRIKVDEECPFMFNNWCELKKENPKFYNLCRRRVKKILSLKYSLMCKISDLYEVLSFRSMNLTVLKANYIELYNLL